MMDGRFPTAIVADRRAFGRHLAAALLTDQGFEVRSEASTLADVLLGVQEEAPERVVLHENVARDHEPAVVAQIRRMSPETVIVILAPGADAGPELAAVVDAVLEETMEISQVGLVGLRNPGRPASSEITAPSGAPAPAAGPVPPPTTAPVPAPEMASAANANAAPGRARSRWAGRAQGAAAVAAIALGVVVLRGAAEDALGPRAESVPPGSSVLQSPSASPRSSAAPGDDRGTEEGPSTAETSEGGGPVWDPGTGPSPAPADDDDPGPDPDPGPRPDPDPSPDPSPPAPSPVPDPSPPPGDSPPASDTLPPGPSVPPPTDTGSLTDGVEGVIDDVTDAIDPVVDGVTSAVGL